MAKKRGKNDLHVEVNEDISEEKVMAKLATDGSTYSAVLIQQFCGLAELDVTESIHAVKDQAKAVKDGDMSALETMLTSQALALDTLFARLAMMSKNNMQNHFSAAEKFMRLALKAQSQCRTTIEAIAEMKNPQPFIQNNKAQYQQVNNHMESDKMLPLRAGAHAGENNLTNELMDEVHV